MTIIGKKHRHTPVLIPEFMFRALDLLTDLDIRKEIGVPDKNKFLFPRRLEDSHLEPCAILRNFAHSKKFKLERPELMRTTDLRKRLATSVQILNLPENQMDWLARFMVRER